MASQACSRVQAGGGGGRAAGQLAALPGVQHAAAAQRQAWHERVPALVAGRAASRAGSHAGRVRGGWAWVSTVAGRALHACCCCTWEGASQQGCSRGTCGLWVGGSPPALRQPCWQLHCCLLACLASVRAEPLPVPLPAGPSQAGAALRWRRDCRAAVWQGPGGR